MVGFGALSSLTSGGDLASSSSSSAGSGDSSSGSPFYGGSLTFGSKQDNTTLFVGLAFIAAIVYLKK